MTPAKPSRLRRSRSWPARFALLAALLTFHLANPTRCLATSADDLTYLKQLSLENLLDIEISSVSKKTEKLSDAAAAIFVITQEDIHRSGSRSLPEVLRMVPGLHVAQIDAHTWAITARGFNGLFASKLLVLIDGRSVYTPLFSGVYWDVQDTLLADIERIEVIRGPGATIWGANAVNGVINIITKQADQTQGWLLQAGTGNLDKATGNLRYGGKIGDQAHFRLYGKYFDHDDHLDDQGSEADNGWDSARGGFRIDWQPGGTDQLTLQGDIYRNDGTQELFFTSLAETFPNGLATEVEASGGNLLARWQRRFSATSALTIQGYYDRTERRDAFLDECRDTWDLDISHRFAPASNQELIWGLGYRFTRDETEPGLSSAMVPDEKSDQLFSLFIQDDLAFFNDRLHLIVGSKLEHNDSTGWEVQPSARLLWAPSPRHTLWAAVSRAVRSPSRSEHDLQAVSGVTVSGSPPTATIRMVMGDNDFVSEELLAYELGYRTQPHQRLSLDLALFYNDYRRLRTLVTGTPIAAGPGTTILPLEFSNRMQGETYGLEAVANIQLRNWWRLAAGYTWFNIALHAAEDVIEATGEGTEGNDPEHQYSLRSTMNLPGNLALDTALYYYDSLHSGDVPAYYRVDVRLGWCPWPTVEVSLKVENLLDDKHPEFKESIFFTRPGQVPRSVYGQISWRF